MSEKNDIVFETCKLLVKHFRNLMNYSPDRDIGFHTRVFSHFLHPESHFVHIGESLEVNSKTPTHPEHVVPCAVLIVETRRLIREGRVSDNKIAAILARHWKVATITKDEANRLDFQLGLKSIMPDGWTFEHGETLARLDVAGIKLKRNDDE